MRTLPRPLRRSVRRLRHWWRGTPPGEIAQTMIALGVVLIVVAGLILLRWH